MRNLNEAQTDRVIQMAWEDRTTFEAIREQFGLEPGQVIKLMRANLKPSSFRLYRERTSGRNTKHLSKRSFRRRFSHTNLPMSCASRFWLSDRRGLAEAFRE